MLMLSATIFKTGKDIDVDKERKKIEKYVNEKRKKG